MREDRELATSAGGHAAQVSFEDIRLTRVDTLDDGLDFRAWLGERRPILAVDTETTGLNVNRDWIKLAQFGDGGAGWALDYRDWRGAIREAIHDYRRPMEIGRASC